ncbi:MAG: M3 family metallopeptidase [Candidatus Gracilibacteria bacterium]|nr:M3 family metallopeptidase [Candidatus Gracilibacteria bacterium]
MADKNNNGYAIIKNAIFGTILIILIFSVISKIENSDLITDKQGNNKIILPNNSDDNNIEQDKEENKTLSRDEIDSKYKWDLTKVYFSIEEAEKDLEEVEKLLPEFPKYKGKLNNNEKLLEFLKLQDTFSEKLGKVSFYARLRTAINAKDEEADLLSKKVQKINLEYVEGRNFFSQELKNFSDKKLNALLKNVEFSDYKNTFRFYLNEKKHILPENEEKIVASFRKASAGYSTMYNQLMYGDIEYPEIETPEGEKITANLGGLISIVGHSDREFKKKFYETIFGTYKKYENTLGNLFIADKKETVAFKKSYKYNSVLESIYQNKGLGEEVYKNFVEVGFENKQVMHKYITFLKNYFGYEKIYSFDFYTPLIKNDKKYTYEEVKKIIFSGLKKLGGEYLDALKVVSNDGQIDVYPAKNKDGNPFSTNNYAIQIPYTLLSFGGKFNDIFNFAHELGHSVNSYESMNNQPYRYAGMTFPREIPSITNELLISKQMAEEADTIEEKLKYLGAYMSTIRNNFWGINIESNLEKQVYDKIWNDQVVTISGVNKLYLDLEKQYYGEDYKTLEGREARWYILTQYYRPYYFHDYALSVAVADNIATRLYNNEPGFKEKYMEYLKTGSSELPNDALKKLGIDLTKKDYLEDFMESQNKVIDEIIKLSEEIKEK